MPGAWGLAPNGPGREARSESLLRVLDVPSCADSKGAQRAPLPGWSALRSRGAGRVALRGGWGGNPTPTRAALVRLSTRATKQVRNARLRRGGAHCAPGMQGEQPPARGVGWQPHTNQRRPRAWGDYEQGSGGGGVDKSVDNFCLTGGLKRLKGDERGGRVERKMNELGKCERMVRMVYG